MNIRVSTCAIFCVLLFVSWCPPSSAMVEISGTIDGDTTWTDTDTIKVTGDVFVTSTGWLTVQNGAIVLFASGTGLYISGQLTADGDKFNHIVFSSDTDTIGGAPVAGDWTGVRFEINSSGILHYCDLRYAITNVDIYHSSPELNTCIIENFLNTGVSVDGAISSPPITPVFIDCVIGQNQTGLLGTGIGIYVYRTAEVTISGCVISNCLFGLEFYGLGSYRPFFQVSECDIRNNSSRGIYAHAGG